MAVRPGDWKLIDWYWGKEPERFNLAADPGEQTDVAAEHPEKIMELRRLLDTFRGDTAANTRDLHVTTLTAQPGECP